MVLESIFDLKLFKNCLLENVYSITNGRTLLYSFLQDLTNPLETWFHTSCENFGYSLILWPMVRE